MYREQYADMVALLEDQIQNIHRNDRRIVSEARARVDEQDHISKSDLDELQDLVSQL